MNKELSQIYYGFRLERQEPLKELSGEASVFTHVKSGAKLIFIANGDTEKSFLACFRTLPQDDTGVAHILEHSCLGGSAKFPVREPFAEIAKGSLNTIINASTGPDRTQYFFASQNDKDFMNLLDVYLDAIFHPTIYTVPEMLMQEGWHYEINDRDELVINGVVYNEMKGALSAPEDRIEEEMNKALYDNFYKNCSGGDPKHIPELTQEMFTAFHKKYYHPSNCCMVVCGDANMDEVLKFMDEAYLHEYTDEGVRITVPYQPVKTQPVERVIDYPIAANEDETKKAVMELSFVTGDVKDRELDLKLTVLADVLLDSEAAPLKAALMKAGLGQVSGGFSNGNLQPTFSVQVQGANAARKSEFQKIVFDTLKELAQNGLDKKSIEASINRSEFNLREGNFGPIPMGIMSSFWGLNGWEYGCPDLLEHYRYEEYFDRFRKNMASRQFEEVIEKCLLKNPYYATVVMNPRKDLPQTDEIAEELKKKRASMTAEEVQAIRDATARLRKKQTTPDSEEALATIPRLSLTDIEPKVTAYTVSESKKEGITLYHHVADTNRIAYTACLFDLSCLQKEELPYAAVLADTVGKLGTKEKSFADVSNDIAILTGGITANFAAFGKVADPDDAQAYFVLNIKTVNDKVAEGVRLAVEILTKTVYDDVSRLQSVLATSRMRQKMAITGRGNRLMMQHLLSYFSKEKALLEEVSGIGYYLASAEIEKELAANAAAVVEKVKAVAEKLFRKDNLSVLITGDAQGQAQVEEKISGLIAVLGTEKTQRYPYEFVATHKDEALTCPMKVQYVAKGGNFAQAGFRSSGALLVAKTILSKDYLWNMVRIQGGAYHVMETLTPQGDLAFASYRDPKLAETFRVYDHAGEFLRNFDATQSELEKLIIGTINDLDAKIKKGEKGMVALRRHLCGITTEQLQKERDEVLHVTVEQIRACGDVIDAVMKQNYHSALGNTQKLQENASLFAEVKVLF